MSDLPRQMQTLQFENEFDFVCWGSLQWAGQNVYVVSIHDRRHRRNSLRMDDGIQHASFQCRVLFDACFKVADPARVLFEFFIIGEQIDGQLFIFRIESCNQSILDKYISYQKVSFSLPSKWSQPSSSNQQRSPVLK